ncbi:hypothetical protein NN561_015794 [Cricetulus griseus]
MWRCHSPPEEVRHLEEEYPFMDIWNAGLPPEYIETGSRLSISSTEEDVCCLGHKAEETLRLVGTNRPISPTAEANTSIFNWRNGGSYIPAGRQCVFKILSLIGPACLPTLPPPLRRSGSEPALPTFLASDNNKGQEEVNKERGSKGSVRPSSPGLCGLPDVRCSGNSAPRHDGEEAEREKETGSTITFSCASLDVPRFSEDTNCKWISGPQDAEVTKSSNRTSGVNEIGLHCSVRTHDAVKSIGSLQDRDTKTQQHFEETSNGPISPKAQPQGAHRASDNSRRGWKWVRSQISDLLTSFCCFLLTLQKEDTASRSPWYCALY